MEHGIHITGGTVDTESVSVVTGAITELMQKAYDTRASDAILLSAMSTLQRMTPSVQGMSLSGCTVDARRVVNVDTESN